MNHNESMLPSTLHARCIHTCKKVGSPRLLMGASTTFSATWSCVVWNVRSSAAWNKKDTKHTPSLRHCLKLWPSLVQAHWKGNSCWPRRTCCPNTMRAPTVWPGSPLKRLQNNKKGWTRAEPSIIATFLALAWFWARHLRNATLIKTDANLGMYRSSDQSGVGTVYCHVIVLICTPKVWGQTFLAFLCHFHVLSPIPSVKNVKT